MRGPALGVLAERDFRLLFTVRVPELELMPQHKQLDALQVQPAATPNERAKKSPEREVKKREDHAANPPSRRRQATRHEYWHPSSDTKALISVSDDGPGVTAEEHETIFEPGVRGKSAGDRSDGSGLGLALALRVARSAGGNISAQPSGSGGHFIVELPLA